MKWVYTYLILLINTVSGEVIQLISNCLVLALLIGDVEEEGLLHIFYKTVFPDNYAVVLDVTQILMEQAKSCDVAIMEEYFFPYLYSVGLQNNSVYNNAISGT